MQLQCKQLAPDTEGKGGYVTLYGKHGGHHPRDSLGDASLSTDLYLSSSPTDGSSLYLKF